MTEASSTALEQPGPLPGAASHEARPWTPIPELLPVAAALRALKHWSLDGPARQFDAHDWWYRLVFDAPDPAPDERVVLGFDGLATIAQVWLNGKTLLTSTNMFVAHECDVTGILKGSGNELMLRFSGLDAQLAIKRKRPRWRAPMVEHQQMRWFRTTLLGRTPGWSPPAAVVGPWKDIWLERRRIGRPENIQISATVCGSHGLVSCSMQTSTGATQKNSASTSESVHLKLERNGKIYVQRLTELTRPGVLECELSVPDVDLWWPHTHGEPALYTAELLIRKFGRADDETINLQKLGFRTITVDTANGNFALSVNNTAVFCRGACWTPIDPVSLRSTAAQSYAAVAQARVAGMNMLRILGTMVYEEDHFYAACSEQGLLVWQDFMFANMDYPFDDEDFAASTELEVFQQLERLKLSPCLAVLCGNSEVEQQAAMWGASKPLWRPAFFEMHLAARCAAIAPGTLYWPSSAHGGAFPHQADTGTSSYYGVGAYLQTPQDARRSNLKFATECLAFANVPQASALERLPGGLTTRVHHPAWKQRSPRDLGAGWDFDDVRDHYLEATFNTSPQKLRYADHDRYLTLSRVTTGEVMAATFSDWRRPASACQGAMVLFLRDLWAGAGWGLVDDAGVPKACYYYLKRVLQPLAVMLSDEGVNGLFVHMCNDYPQARQLELEVTAWRGGNVQLASGKKQLRLAAHSAETLACIELFDYFMDLSYAYRFGPLPCDAVVATLKDEQGQQVTQAFYLPAGMGQRSQCDAGLTVQAIMVDEKTVRCHVHAEFLAFAVHFDVPGFQADDDYFHMAPDTSKTVMLRSTSRSEAHGFVQAINSCAGTRVEPAPLKASISQYEFST